MLKKILLIMLFINSICQQTETYSQTNNIRITNWNIYMLPEIINNSYKIRAELIADYILQNNSDVFVIQEAFNTTAINIIYNKVKNVYPYQIKPIKTNNLSFKINNGLWIISKHPINNHDFYKFNKCYGYDNLAQKGILYSEIKINKSTFQIFNTHLNSGKNNQDIRNNQYIEVKNFIDKHKKENQIQIICGDFNTNKSDKLVYNKMIKNIGLNDYISDELTYDANHNDMVDEYIVDIIDYIFTRNNSKILYLEERCINKPEKQWSDNHKDLSDHYPVILKLTKQDNFYNIFNSKY